MRISSEKCWRKNPAATAEAVTGKRGSKFCDQQNCCQLPSEIAGPESIVQDPLEASRPVGELDVDDLAGRFDGARADGSVSKGRRLQVEVEEDLLSESDFQAALLQTAPPEPSVGVFAEEPAEGGAKTDLEVEPQ